MLNLYQTVWIKTLSYNNIIAKRPGGGISPLYYKKIIGKKLKKKVKDEHKFSWKDFSKN